MSGSDPVVSAEDRIAILEGKLAAVEAYLIKAAPHIARLSHLPPTSQEQAANLDNVINALATARQDN